MKSTNHAVPQTLQVIHILGLARDGGLLVSVQILTRLHHELLDQPPNAFLVVIDLLCRLHPHAHVRRRHPNQFVVEKHCLVDQVIGHSHRVIRADQRRAQVTSTAGE
jgi:hypothetical protein